MIIISTPKYKEVRVFVMEEKIFETENVFKIVSLETSSYSLQEVTSAYVWQISK